MAAWDASPMLGSIWATADCDKPHAASGVVQIAPDNKLSAAQNFPVCETCLAAADTDAVIRKFYSAPDLKISEGGEATDEQITAMAERRDEIEH